MKKSAPLIFILLLVFSLVSTGCEEESLEESAATQEVDPTQEEPISNAERAKEYGVDYATLDEESRELVDHSFELVSLMQIIETDRHGAEALLREHGYEPDDVQELMDRIAANPDSRKVLEGELGRP